MGLPVRLILEPVRLYTDPVPPKEQPVSSAGR
jgi:hypothetical protein